MQRIDLRFYFDISGNMESSEVLAALGSLAQEHRLALFRLLVQAGPEGMAAGALAERLAVPNSSLSFHLAHLQRASLIDQRREGRSLIYRANTATMFSLMAFLTENCCGGADCTPNSMSNAKRRSA